MIKIQKVILILVLSFLLLFSLSYATKFTDWLKEHNLDEWEYVQIGPGSFYKKIDIPEIPLSIDIIEIKLKDKYINIDLQKPDNSLYGKGTVSNIVKDEIEKDRRVVAAINSSFWESSRRPVGLFIDEGVMYNINNYRSSLIKTKHNKFIISKTNLNISFSFKRNKIKIDNVNDKGEEDKVVVYTSPFKDEITLKENEIGIVVDIGNQKFTPTNKVKGNIIKFLEPNQKITTDKNSVVLIGEKDSIIWLKEAPLNSKVKFYIRNSTFRDDIEFAVTGAPQIVKDGKNIYQGIDEKISESFINTSHPRTGCGIAKNKKTIYLVVIDGRQPNFSIGVNLDEFAQLFMKLSSYNAINLDGGGSTTMVVGNQIMNSPSDYTGERIVSDAILLLSQAKVSNPQIVKIMNYDNNFSSGSKTRLFAGLFDKTYSPIYKIVGDAYMRSSKETDVNTPLTPLKRGLENEFELSCDNEIGKIIDNNTIEFSSEPAAGKIHCSYKQANLQSEKNIFVQDIDKLLIYPEELNLTVGKNQKIYINAFDKNNNRLHLENEFINIISSDKEILDFENNVIAVPKKEGEGIITIDTGKMVKVLKFNVKSAEKTEEKK